LSVTGSSENVNTEIVAAPIVVKNDEFLSGAGRSEIIKHGYERQLEAVTESLRGSDAFSPEQKQAIAGELSKPQSSAALLQTIGRPECAVAFAAVRCGAADLEQATCGLPTSDARIVEGLVDRANEIDEVSAELKVCSSEKGYYLGKMGDGEPGERHSAEYWKDKAEADKALETGQFRYRNGNEHGPGLEL